jgi:hypothetical protein
MIACSGTFSATTQALHRALSSYYAWTGCRLSLPSLALAKDDEFANRFTKLVTTKLLEENEYSI